MRSWPSLLLAAGLAVSMPLAASAQDLGLDFSGGSFYQRGTFENFGWDFSLSQSRTVDALGVFDTGALGFADDHPVGIWDAQGDLVASATVTNAATSVASASSLGVWRFQTITPVVLQAGDYVIGAWYPTPADLFIGNATGVVTDPDVTYLHEAISPGVVTTFAEPMGTFTAAGPGLYGANLEFGVPEPASWALMILGFGGMGAALRQKRRRVGISGAARAC